MQIKIKIYKIAKELNISDNEVIEKAKDLNIVLKSSQSVVTFEESEKIKKYILDTSINLLKEKIDFSVIEKRLKLLSLALEYEDYDIVEILISKILEINDLDNKVVDIITNVEFNLRFHQFEHSLNEISDYLNKKLQQSTTIIKYDDIELLELKQELKKLEIKFQELIEQKTEYLNDIEDFNTQYNIHLGELIKTILNLKKEILYKKTIKHQKLKKQFEANKDICDETKQTIDELKNTVVELEEILENIDEDDENYEEIKGAYDEIKEELENLEDELLIQEEELEKIKEKIEEDEVFEEEYEEAKSTYEEFDNEYEHIKDTQKDVQKLNDEDKKELKLLYKRAAKLCHPDIVSEEFKEKAHEIMQSLNDAYSKKDISQVKKILLSLENGTTFKTVSSDIDNKELLLSKIKEFEQNIIDLQEEIETIKEDDTYTTISELENWDEYFEELKSEFQKEKDNLEDEARRVLDEKEEVEEWIQNLWDWADENNIPNGKLARQKENLLATTTIEFIGLKLTNIPKELCELENITTLVLWDNNISSLPDEIVNFTNLKKLNLRGNLNLEITQTQKNWIDNLKHCTIYMDEIKIKNDVNIQIKQNEIEINKEESEYSNTIKSIEVVNFEKIRRYCNNLLNDNQADDMQEYLANNGKMYKAIIYDALEQFISKLDGQTITLVDWGCNQGIASMVVLDYIKEKQLNIKVSNSILIDDDIKALSRAMVHTNVLSYSTDIKISAYDLNDDISKILEKIDNQIVLNLMVNDEIYEKIENIDFKNDYFLCLSNKNNVNIDKFYKELSNLKDVENLSIKNTKIGKFEKFERIFKLNDEIQF